MTREGCKMNSRERINRIIDHQPVDRVGVFEHFWEDTRKLWVEQGHVDEDQTAEEHFGLDIDRAWCLNTVADLDAEEKIVEEDEKSKLVRDGNGALLRFWKDKCGTPEHVDFEVKDRKGWEEKIRPHLTNRDDHRRRIGFENYRQMYKRTQEEGLFSCWGSVNVFESMHPVCGHEYMLMGMALDPDWVKDMCNVFSDMIIETMEILFAEEGKPDGVWFYEDMGFKGKPFMSPAMYKDIVWPAHKKTFGYAHSIGCKVLVHSCGFVEPLVGGLIEAGMDCLQAIETKAGMDLVHLKQKFGDEIAFMGGLDIRVLESNDTAAIDEMLETILSEAMKGSGYILHTDHSIPPSVSYDTYKYFLNKGLEIGSY